MQGTFLHLREAVRHIENLLILEWRDGYGESGSLHCGTWSQEQHQRTTRQRGSWIITIWEARVRLTAVPTSVVLEHPPFALGDLRLGRFVGDSIERAHVAASGALELHLSSGARIDVIPELDGADDADQWVIETPSAGVFLMRSGPIVLREPNANPASSA